MKNDTRAQIIAARHSLQEQYKTRLLTHGAADPKACIIQGKVEGITFVLDQLAREAAGLIPEAKKINPQDWVDKALVQLQTKDHGPNGWTAPVTLTEDKLERIYAHKNLRKIRIKPDGQETVYELDVL